MESLPYELLQIVSNSLLPRDQCRFALVSRHHYRYLYNDMLRWHACKAPISVPKCDITGEKTLLYIDKRVLLFYSDRVPLGSSGVLVYNLTTAIDTLILMRYDITHINYIEYDIYDIYYEITNSGALCNLPVRKYVRYLNKDILLALWNHAQPCCRLKYKIWERIKKFLDEESIITISGCVHMRYVMRQ